MWMILMTAPVHPENNWPQIWFQCYSHCQSLCAGLKRVFTLLSPSLHICTYFLCFISLFEQSNPSSGSVLVQPANLLRTGLFSLQTHIIHFLWTSLILMDCIDSSCVAPRFACRHERSNRTAASKDDLVLSSAQKNVYLKAQNPSGLCFHSDQLRFIFYVCDVLFFSHQSRQTLFADASFKHNKTKTIFVSMKVFRVPKCCIAGNWTCFFSPLIHEAFTSISIRLCTDPTITESGAAEINPWSITLCETFVSTDRFPLDASDVCFTSNTVD